MKRYLIILLTLFLASCIHETNPIQTNGVILSKEYVAAKSEYTYHYGISVSGKLCWHWGMEDISVKYNTNFLFLGDTNKWNDYILYNKTKSGDTIKIIYVNRFTMSREDTTNVDTRIKKIITQDTIINY